MAERTERETPTKNIQVLISYYKHGHRVFDDVQMVRIVSKDYTLLVMNDYMPSVGLVEGSVDIIQNENIQTLKNIHAYYLNRKNVFTLLVDSQKEE